MYRFIAFCLTLAMTAFAASADEAAPKKPERIVFPFKNAPDLRGVLNLLEAYRIACLAQAPTAEVADALLPEGYKVVTMGQYMWGEEVETLKDTAVLTMTGSEETDMEQGFPAIELKLPNEKRAEGNCKVSWNHPWNEGDDIKQLSTAMAATLASQISFNLHAILLTRPDSGFTPSDNFGIVQNWVAICDRSRWCRFNVLAMFQKDGILIKIGDGLAPD